MTSKSHLALLLLLLVHLRSSLGLLECSEECQEDEKTPKNSLRAICASDGHVYESLCDMRRRNCGEPGKEKNVTQATWEECRGRHPLCPGECLSIQDPVCGQDGTVYPNKCIMQKRNCGKPITSQDMKVCLKSNRQGRRLEACPAECQELYKPVCASNGKIYLNHCHLRKETCGEKVALKKMTYCVDVPKCPETCIALYDPVCGSNGKVYLNHCRMALENCPNGRERVTTKPRSFCVGEENKDKF